MLSDSVFDHPLVKRAAILRKGLAFAAEPVLEFQRQRLSWPDFAEAPPIIVNSLPKSGTHLLLQITRAIPRSRYFGRFIATTPSLTLRARTPEALARRIARLMPAETLGAHLYYCPEVAEAMEQVNALHLFIYRDPRDVVMSEAHYLADMNRWHRMHKHFQKLSSEEERLSLALRGLDERYPEANARLLHYAGWVNAPGVTAIRYEDLTGPRQADEIGRVVAAWQAKAGGAARGDTDLVEQLQGAIDPGKSHTFREGGSRKWLHAMSEAGADELTQQLRPSLAAYGYPV